MARRSARLQSSQDSSPAKSSPQQSSPAGNRKRKAETGASPSAKRGKKDEDGKAQISIEDAMDIDKSEPKEPESSASAVAQPDPHAVVEKPQTDAKPATETDDKPEVKQDATEPATQSNGHAEPEKKTEEAPKAAEPSTSEAPVEAESEDKPAEQAKEQIETRDAQPAAAPTEKPAEKPEDKSEPKQESQAATNGDAVEPNARDEEVPSSILEKGIFYFLYRGRVNIESPDNVQDIARSYLVLRPLPHGAKLSDGPMGDDKNCRLIAIPKKMLPVSGNDRWTAFVESANKSIKELKENFLKDDHYETQAGSRHTPAVTPAAEGVYAITTTGRESHMAYMVTLPEDLGKVQNDLGLRNQGSFILSTKNPKAPGPASANIGKDPGFPQEIQDDFRSLRWAPSRPAMFDYEGCQFLMIGEGEQGIDKATEPQDGQAEKEADPKEELEKLEKEDEMRVEHLKGEDAVFADLGTNAKDYPKLQTTW